MNRQLFASLFLACVAYTVGAAHQAPAAALRVGAARIDYTPATLPPSFTGVLDPIYVRSIVVDNGSTRAALISVDAGAISTDLYNKVSARAAKDIGIPAAQIMLSATHTHSVAFQTGSTLEDIIVQSLRDAVSRLQPARMAWGTGVSYININRDRVDPVTNRWWEGPNYEAIPTRLLRWCVSRRLQARPSASTTIMRYTRC